MSHPTASIDPGSIISRSFKVYTDNFAVAVPIALGLFAIGLVVDLIVGTSFVGQSISSIVSLILTAVLTGVLVHLVRDYQDGTLDSTPGQLFSAAQPVILPLILASILVAIIVVIGLFLIIVPGILAAIMLAVVSPVIVIERAGVIDALGRSKALTQGQWGQIFILGLALIAIFIVVGIAAAILAVPLALLGGTVGAAIAGWLISGVLQPIGAIIVAVLYFDLRAVKGEPPIGAGAAGPQTIGGFQQPGYPQQPPAGQAQPGYPAPPQQTYPPQGQPQPAPPVQPPAPQPGYQQPPQGGEPPKQL